jgi:hypothetical protein
VNLNLWLVVDLHLVQGIVGRALRIKNVEAATVRRDDRDDISTACRRRRIEPFELACTDPLLKPRLGYRNDVGPHDALKHVHPAAAFGVVPCILFHQVPGHA